MSKPFIGPYDKLPAFYNIPSYLTSTPPHLDDRSAGQIGNGMSYCHAQYLQCAFNMGGKAFLGTAPR